MNSRAARSGRWVFDLSEGIELVGIVAAVLVAIFANVLVARHYTRWDVTSDRRFTLSPPTLTTLRDLPEPIEVWILLGANEPLTQSMKPLLASYEAQSKLLDVHWVDPDRDVLAFEEAKKRFRIQAGRSEAGRLVTDAVAVVARGERTWFIGAADLFETDPTDSRVRPKGEQALTTAIRGVLGGEKQKLCFTQGHGELNIEDSGPRGLFHLREIVTKNNYEPVSIETLKVEGTEPFRSCAVVVVARPTAPFAEAEASRLASYVLAGGSVFVGASPLPAESGAGIAKTGLDPVLAPFGIALEDALVFERDDRFVVPETERMRFFVEVKPHTVSQGLAAGEIRRDLPNVVLHVVRPVRRLPNEAAPTDLLSTSSAAFAVRDFEGAADAAGEPPPKSTPGPHVVAMANEIAAKRPGAPHGARVVVVGTGSVFAEANWLEALPVRGAAFFTENAIAWLAAKPPMVDVPPRASLPAGVHITEEARGELMRYVLFYLPGATALLGIAVFFRRRSTERAPRTKGA